MDISPFKAHSLIFPTHIFILFLNQLTKGQHFLDFGFFLPKFLCPKSITIITLRGAFRLDDPKHGTFHLKFFFRFFYYTVSPQVAPFWLNSVSIILPSLDSWSFIFTTLPSLSVGLSSDWVIFLPLLSQLILNVCFLGDHLFRQALNTENEDDLFLTD